jgi:UDP-glucose 4-epimerase
MNILLTGGAGYIGSHTALSLIDNGHSVTVIDNLITGNKALIPSKVKHYNFDISDEISIKKILKENRFDIVMHFAGLTRVEESVKYPEKYQLHNFEKSKIFFLLCIKNNLKKIIFSSSAGVYGNSNSSNLTEDSELKPINPYAESKYKIENFLIEISKKDKVDYTILRYFNVAGADKSNRSGLIAKSSSNLIKVLCEVATNKREKIIINGDDYKTKDGTAIRDFIHVTDIADMHVLAANNLIKKPISNIYNCGYGSGYSVKEVINEMENIIKNKLQVDIGPRRLNDIAVSVANSDKFKKEFNWKPRFNNLNIILSSALNWEKNNS